VFHVAITDDWEASMPFGSYEAATRGPGQGLRTTTTDGVQRVLDERYSDLRLQLVVVELDVDAFADLGIEIVTDTTGGVRIGGPLPPGDRSVVVRVVPVPDIGGRWVAPMLGRA